MKSKERLVELPADYATILAALRDQIRSARLKAGLAVNREVVILYWRIGRQILKQQHEERWALRLLNDCLWISGESFRR
jgi:hypothetical protein